jgi:uncharacterized protein
MWKISQYNHFQPWRDGLRIAYNARSGAVALMDPDNYSTYCRLKEKLASDTHEELSDDEQTLLKQLQYGQFVCDADFDELGYLKFRHNLDRYMQKSLGLVVAPTNACNMACKYCFEQKDAGRMSPRVVEAIIELVERQAPSIGMLDVCWYGGEPLLAMDTIEDFSETFLDLGREHNFQFGASMISNGYLLDRETVDRLAALEVKSVQVTLDGPSHVHNRKRPLRTGKPSFDRIVENIGYASTKMAVTIRVNVDKTFTPELIAELLDELAAAGLQQRASVYFAQLEASTPVCAAIAESCYATADFSKIEIDYYRLMLEKGFRIDRLPSPISVQCMAQVVNCYLIDSEGYLYRCYNHVGQHQRAVGTILDPIDYQHPNFTRLFRFDPFEDQQCRECELLPICMGGCPARRVDRGLSGTEMCESWKHNLQPMLEIIALSRQQAARKPQETEKEPA